MGCYDSADAMGVDVNCATCSAFTKRYELLQVGIGTGFFGEDWAMIIVDGEVKRVSLSRVYDIKEE
jgi:hypothetical protein